MKHNYKINIDPEVPSDTEIGRHKDFGRILADYHNLTQPIYRKPLYKNPKAFAGLVLILVIAGLVFWTVEKEDEEKAKQEQLAEIPAEVKHAEKNSFLQAPSLSLSLPSESFDFDLGKDSQVKLQDGTTISIPAKSLGGADGSMYEGPARLNVRQIDDLAELIAMGLPLQTDGQLIHPTQVLEILPFFAHDGAPEALHLNGAAIKIEVPLAANDNQPRQLFVLDSKTRAWKPNTPSIAPVAKPSMQVSKQKNDGFGVVEYDAKGKIIPKAKSDGPSDQRIQVLQFELDQVGTICLGMAQGKQVPSPGFKARFTDAQGNALHLLTLYGLAQGRNAVAFHWPKTADFAFDIQLAAGTNNSFLGFLSDGRLASISKVRELKPGEEVNVLQMQVSEAPVRDIQELKQLIAQFTGL